jgi:hypothetical protein
MTELFRLDDAFNKKYFVEARTASYVWLYRRQPAGATGVGEASGGSSQADSAEPGPVPAAAIMNEGEATAENTGTSDLLTFVAEPFGPKQVQFAARVVRQPDQPDTFRLDLRADLADGWHLFAPGASSVADAGSAHQAAIVTLELGEGMEAAGEMKIPPGEPAPQSPRERILAGHAVWQQVLRCPPERESADSIVVNIEYQVCNDQYCLPVETISIPVAVPR